MHEAAKQTTVGPLRSILVFTRGIYCQLYVGGTDVVACLLFLFCLPQALWVGGATSHLPAPSQAPLRPSHPRLDNDGKLWLRQVASSVSLVPTMPDSY